MGALGYVLAQFSNTPPFLLSSSPRFRLSSTRRLLPRRQRDKSSHSSRFVGHPEVGPQIGIVPEHSQHVHQLGCGDRARRIGAVKPAFSYTGPEGALAHGLRHLAERDAQRPCQPKQVLEGRVPPSGFNFPAIGPVHLGQFRQAP